jgi:hypothetical protein
MKRAFVVVGSFVVVLSLVACKASGVAPNPPLSAPKGLFGTNGTSPGGAVLFFAPPYSVAKTKRSGFTDPYGIALNARGDLFVADPGAGAQGTVYEYAPPYTGSPLATITTDMNGPIQIALNAAGDLFVANCGGPCLGSGTGNVAEYAPPYTGTPTLIVSGTAGGPDGVALDSSGDLFVSNYNAGTVVEYAPPYTGAPIATISTSNGPYNLALDSNGDLFVTSQGSGLLEFAPPYTGSPTVITGPPEFAVTLDSSNDLFYGTGSSVHELAPPYTGTPTNIPGFANAHGLVWHK